VNPQKQHQLQLQLHLLHQGSLPKKKKWQQLYSADLLRHQHQHPQLEEEVVLLLQDLHLLDQHQVQHQQLVAMFALLLQHQHQLLLQSLQQPLMIFLACLTHQLLKQLHLLQHL
jgi:hypothetical protein